MPGRDDELLAAIWASPHDDELRDVYADHVEREGDDKRAELIRVQCALARLPADDERRPALVRRERNLWGRHRKLFRRDVHPMLRPYPFERGFVAPLDGTITGHKLMKQYFELLPLAPLWHFTLRSVERHVLETLVASERFARVGRLVMRGYHDLLLIATSPHACNLSALDFDYTGARAADLAALGGLPHLEELRLGSSSLGEGAELIAASDLAPRVRVLHLRSSHLTADGVATLFGGGRFARLEDLDLSYVAPGDDVLASFAATARLPMLRKLRYFGAGLTPAAAQSIASWPGAPGLRELDLNGNVQIGAAGLRILVEAPSLAGLQSLSLYTTTRDDAAMVQLLEQRFRACVRPDRLSVRGTQIE